MTKQNFLMRAARAVSGVVRTVTRLPSDLRKRQKCVVMEGAKLYPSCRISNEQPRGNIVIGPRTVVLGMLQTMGHGGVIRIGSDCYLGENSRIWAGESVTIGDRVLIAHDVNIHDNNAHSDSAASRASHFQLIMTTGHPRQLDDVPTSAVVIHNDAWIGFGTTVLKGVTIGEGAIVGARSLVTHDVPPYTKVVGSPARVIGHALP